MNLMVKICGMRQFENVQNIGQLQPDLMGFIMYPRSPRYVEESTLMEVTNGLNKDISLVAVFVNENEDKVIRICKKYHFSYAQLHGNETAEECKKVKDQNIGIIKAISVSSTINYDQLSSYLPYVDYFLFDTKTSQYGGSGKHFDWELLRNYSLAMPYFLSGGIGNEDIATIKKMNLPGLIGIDTNSQLEIKPGLKDVEATSRLITLIRNR